MKLDPVFDKYFDQSQAEYYNQLFLQNGLHPFVDKPKDEFNVALGNHTNDLQFILRLPVEEFQAAVNSIEHEVRKAGIPEDYPLRQLSLNELKEIIIHTNEWSRQDVIAAKIILEENNAIVNYEQIEKIKDSIRQDKKKKEGTISMPLLVLMYASALLGGFIAIVAGAFVYYSKSTDLDGNTDYNFTEAYRNHGKIVFIIGVTVAFLFLVSRLLFSV